MVDIPNTIKELHLSISLSVECFFVQGIAFLHSISNGYGFRMVEHLNDYKRKYNEKIMISRVKRCINIYHARGLTVERLNKDNKFACIKDEILPKNLIIVAAEKHVSDVKGSIRTVKEGTRCHVHRLPYEHYKKIMVTGCMTKSIKELNQIPSKN